MTSLSEVLSSPAGKCGSPRGLEIPEDKLSHPLGHDVQEAEAQLLAAFPAEKLERYQDEIFPAAHFKHANPGFSLGKCSQLNLPPLPLHI